MFIKMRTTSAGPDGTRFADKVYNVDKAEAEELIKGGYAEATSAPRGDVKEIEEADAPASKNAKGENGKSDRKGKLE